MAVEGYVSILDLRCNVSGLLIYYLTRTVYVGDSASLSFLQSIRRLVESNTASSAFTMDLDRHKLLEASFPVASHQQTHVLPDTETALFLVDSFFANVSPALQCNTTRC